MPHIANLGDLADALSRHQEAAQRVADAEAARVEADKSHDPYKWHEAAENLAAAEHELCMLRLKPITFNAGDA